MPAGPPLTPGVEQFIESIGLYFETYGLPRVCGRIVGLLMVTGAPLSLDEIAAALQVSRASVSTNARLAASTGLAERVGVPGDRRDYYRLGDDPWERRIRVDIEAVARLRGIAERGLEALPPDQEAARAKVRELLDLCELSAEVSRIALDRWLARRKR